MAYFEFPHTRTYDTDLGWLIAAFKEISQKLDEYLENAVITFADPITWDITEQYTALTCVIDTDGTAYLSKQPVPAGVAISNTDYWLPIFNYDDNINELRDQIAYNARTSATTTVALDVGDLVFWNGLLYHVLVPMPAGTAFINGTNIEPYTVDEKINSIDLTSQLEAGLESIRETIAYDAKDSPNTAVPLVVGDLVYWNNVLYKVIADMPAGTAFIEGTNIELKTVSDRITEINTALSNSIATEVSDRIAADTSLQNQINLIQATGNYVYPEEYGAVGDGSADDTDALINTFADGRPVAFVSGRNYKITKTIDLTDVSINGFGASITIVRTDAGFAYNNAHHHVFRIYDNVHIRDVRFLFGYTDPTQVFPNITPSPADMQRGLAFLGANVSVVNCYFEYTQTNTLLVYGENTHNIRVADCVLSNCASGIQCETAADLTQDDYAVTFENCYVNAFSNATGIGCSTFIGCTFEHRGSSYPNFQAGINDAATAYGAATTCINCRFIGNSTYINVIIYGFNTQQLHTHRALAVFTGCVFDGGATVAITVAGNTLFEGCSFARSMQPALVSGMPSATVHITIINCVYLGSGVSGPQYMLTNYNAVPCNLTMIGNHVNEYNGNDLRLLNVPNAAGDATRLVMIGNTTGPCEVSNVRTPALWWNNHRYDGTEALNISWANRIKYRWKTDIKLDQALNASLLSDATFVASAEGVYPFSDRTVRYVGGANTVSQLGTF